eukprot:3406687-Alexandrium_andersonii.AAC.1
MGSTTASAFRPTSFSGEQVLAIAAKASAAKVSLLSLERAESHGLGGRVGRSALDRRTSIAKCTGQWSAS